MMRLVSFSIRNATLVGMVAIILWSSMVALVRSTTEAFGPTQAAALIYTIAAAGLWIIRRPRGLRRFPVRYLLIGGLLFISYEICLTLAVGLASDATQAIEVSVVNYLWPTSVVLFSLHANRGRDANWLVVPGVLIATIGVTWAVSGGQILDPGAVASHISDNPVPYLLAFTGAIVWGIYSVHTPRMAAGHDGITLFFTGVALSYWGIHLVHGIHQQVTVTAGQILVLIAAGSVMASGYACWNIGILHGNVTALAVGSYATPVLSAMFSAVVLHANLPGSFWWAVGFVALGSALSWLGTRSSSVRAIGHRTH